MAFQKKSYEERKAEIDKAFNDIATQVPKVFESEAFKNYLDFASSFHNYSINNQLLIQMQRPGSTMVTGYRSWQEKGRQVNKGEKGIRILAPSSFKAKREVEKLDADGKPVLGADGNPQTEIKEVTVPTFTTVSVFDVSQTSGEPLPELVHNLEGNSREAVNLLEAVEQVCSSPVLYRSKDEDSELLRGANGYFNLTTGEIVVSSDNAIDQQAKTLIHEWAHSRLHGEESDKPRDQKEIEAEATAYVVSRHFGIDTGDYSFNYVGAYAMGKDVQDLKDVLNNIRTNAHEMIDAVEDVYERVQEKNKDIDLNTLTSGRVTEEKNTETHKEEATEEPKEKAKEEIREKSKEEPKEKTEESKEPEKKEEKKEPTEASKEGIQDFGKKIGGAKKDLWKERGLTLHDLDSMNEAERSALIKKDTVWPKPDYKAMKDSGVPVEVAFFIKNVRDNVATAPISNPRLISDPHSEQERYINFVSELRDSAMACKTMSDVEGMKNFMVDHGFAEKEYFFLSATEKGGRYVTNKLLQALDANRDDLIEGVRKKCFLMNEDEKLIAKSGFSFLQYDASRMTAETSLAVRGRYGTEFFYPIEGVKLDDMKDKSWLVLNGQKIMLTGLENREEAEKLVLSFLKKNKEAEKEGEKESDTETKKRKTSLKPPTLAHIERTGPEYRTKEATGQDYLDAFVFRGGEFGNWLNENERQTNLNMGFDAFKDLGKALGISDKDVALDGRLSIAFGSRGNGKALAHYEPLREVINLTKTKGAGSLGHEWIHAMDDIVGKNFGLKGMMSEANWQEKKLVPESFKKLMESIEYKTVTSADDKRAFSEQGLNERKEELKTSLHSISRPWQDQTLKEKREQLIQNCVDKAGTPEFMASYREFTDFQAGNGDHNPTCSRNLRWIESQNKTYNRLAEEIQHPEKMPDIKVETDFKKNAEEIDAAHSKSGHGYWSSPCEMLARAGAVYIAEKCSDMGIHDDYLNGHAVSWSTSSPTVPLGEERKTINKAFDSFFDDMRTRGIFKTAELAERSGMELDDVIANAEKIAEKQQPKTPTKPPKAKETKDNKDKAD